MAGPRRNGFRGGNYGRWDRRENGLRPENALSRAAQLVDVGQVAEANQALYEIITDNGNRRRQWSKTYEGIMKRLMELSVQLRKPAMVKEALHKYRAMCMQSNVSSLDEVVHSLIAMAEASTEAARTEVGEIVVEGADDLEEGAMETPETLLLEAAGHPLTKERVDRLHVIPWMRFLWETYRVVLDIVKTHSKLESCYHEMAARAFNFCIKYKRFMEFRRLCDMLRMHLNTLIVHPRNTPNDVKITDSDTLQKFLETRFTQLSTSVTLQHWQEAYRTIEDIHMIISMGKTKTKPVHMSIYYDKLMQVFWVSGNYLYHAHTLYKLYSLSVRQNKNLSQGEQRTMASKLLLAALSIPVYDAQSAVLSDSYGAMSDVLGAPTSENSLRHTRMASLLGYTSPAERGALIKELLSKGVLKDCHPELHGLYDLLEGEMAPLQFSERVKEIISFVEGHEILKEYTLPLRRVAIFRLLEQLGRVYDVMRMENVKKVASFALYSEVEETALTALKTRSLSLRFDHQNQCLRFGSELFSTEGMRSQLGRLGYHMAKASNMLTEKSIASDPSPNEMEIVTVAREMLAKGAARRLAAIQTAKSAAPNEEKKVLLRRELIERRKEAAERRNAEMVKQKKLRIASELQAARDRAKKAEAARKEKEAQLRLQKNQEEAAARLGVPGVDALEDDAAREERLKREKEAEFRQMAELKKKAQAYAMHLNHVERALREEQWGALEKSHEEEVDNLSRVLEEVAKNTLEESKARHALAMEEQEKTLHIVPAFERYMDTIMEDVDGDFEKWVNSERARMEEQKAIELAEREAIEKQEQEEADRIEMEREEQERMREEQEKEERKHAARERMNSRLSQGFSTVPSTRSGMGMGAPSLKSDIKRADKKNGGGRDKKKEAPLVVQSKFSALSTGDDDTPAPAATPATAKYRPPSRTPSTGNTGPTRLRTGMGRSGLPMDNRMQQTSRANTTTEAPPAGRRRKFINSKKDKAAEGQ